MPDSELDSEVKRLLNERRGDWPRVVLVGGVSHSWISKFVRGDITNPRYGTLKKLHKLLTSPEFEPKVKAPPQPETNGA